MKCTDSAQKKKPKWSVTILRNIQQAWYKGNAKSLRRF